VDSQSVADLLAREAELLEEITYRLAVLSCLARAGQSAWVARSAGEVEESADMLRLTGLLRATRAGALARSLGLDANATVSQLVAACAPEEADELDAARRQLVEATARAQAAAGGAEAVLGSRAASVQAALDSLCSDPPSTYAPAGTARGRHAAIVRSVL
jgi:hypothetical protein